MQAYENFQLKAIEVKLEKLIFLVEQLHSGKGEDGELDVLPEWVTMEQCAYRKGGASLSSVPMQMVAAAMRRNELQKSRRQKMLVKSGCPGMAFRY